MKGGCTETDFIGFAVLSTTLFPLKGEVSNHKGIFDEEKSRGEPRFARLREQLQNEILYDKKPCCLKLHARP